MKCVAIVGAEQGPHNDNPRAIQECVKHEVDLLRSQLDEARRAPVEHIPWIGFEVTSSAVVQNIVPDSAACKAGVKDGDTCLKVGPVPVTTLEQFRLAVKGHVHAGMMVAFTLQRGAATMVVNIHVRCISMKPKPKRKS